MFNFQLKVSKKDFFNEKWWPAARAEWLPVLLHDNKKYWISQTSPEGIPWRPLSSKYSVWKEARYGNQPILRATGHMQDTAQIKSWGNRIFVKSAHQGIYHQYGTSKMASRPWMGVPSVSLQRLPSIAWKHILK